MRRSARILGGTALGAVLVLSFVEPSGRAHTCKAEVRRRGDPSQVPRFGFVFEHSDESIQVFAITVKLAGEVICQVATPRRDGFRPYVGDWTYGEVPPGFQVEKACAALAAGKTYEITVIGSCLGSGWFTLGVPTTK
jgi:hypothetical protein